jgi:hypothetical protein
MNFKLSLLISSLLAITTIYSCKKDDPDTKTYDVPTTYNFDSVDYSGQTARLDMLGELSTAMKTGNTKGTSVSATTLKDMYANTNSPFTGTGLNTSGKKLKDKTFLSEQTVLEGYMDALAAASQSAVDGADGTAGVVGTYLCDANGIEHIQWIEKGIFGSVFFYQIAEVYLNDSKIGASVAKKDRQHHWDEAFGYYGVPKDFPTNKTGIRYLGKYGNDRDALLGINATIMNAFLKGRAAINNDDNAEVTKQATIIKETIEKVLASTAIKYLNDATKGFGTDATRNHTLSEAIAFIRALKFNSSKKISDTQLADVLSKLGTNNWNITQQNITDARNSLSTIYGLDAVKDQL